MEEKIEVAVIGAGTSPSDPFRHHHVIPSVALTSDTGPGGLAVLKSLKEEGFNVTVYEKRAGIGGVWAFSDDPETTSTLPCEMT